MRNLSLIALVMVPFVLVACSPKDAGSSATSAAAVKGFDQTKLDSSVAELIRLLEAKEYATALKTFSTPEQLKSMTGGKPLDEAIKEMEPIFPLMLESLKKAKDITPTMEDDDKRAVYKLIDKPDQKESVTFVKIDGRWYAGK